MANEEQQKGLEIEMSAEVAQGKYANLALIAHGPNEFFIDMICVAPNMPKAKVQSRIIMTPENAKNLMMAITENVRKYEQNFGTITPKKPAAPRQDAQFQFLGTKKHEA